VLAIDGSKTPLLEQEGCPKGGVVDQVPEKNSYSLSLVVPSCSRRGVLTGWDPDRKGGFNVRIYFNHLHEHMA
jgi:hypothetical protein